MMTTEEQTEAKPAAVAGEVKKWTVVAGDPPGKIQVKRINDAWNGLKSEHNHYVEVNGIVGVSEDRTAFYSPFGGGSRSEVTEAMIRVGERFNWQASRANATAIVAAILAELPALKESRPVKDERRTPEQDAEQNAKAEAWRAEQEKAAVESRTIGQKALADAKAAYPWAHQTGSRWARGAVNIRTMLGEKFPGIQFRGRSESYSGGCSIRIGWDNGPTNEEVRKVTWMFSDGSFDGMTDSYNNDNDAARDALREWMGGARHVFAERTVTKDVQLAIARGLCEMQHVELPADWDPAGGNQDSSYWTFNLPGLGSLRDELHKVLQTASIPAGGVFERIENENGRLVARFTAPATPPAPVVEDSGPAPSTTSAAGVTVRHNKEHDGVEIRFPGKPAAAVLTDLKAAGFRWSRFSQVWYKKMGAYAWAQAHRIAGIELPADGGPGRNEGEDPAGAMVQANEEAGQDQVARDIGA